MSDTKEIESSLLSSYTTALAEELVREVGKSAQSGQDLLVDIHFTDGCVVLVGHGREISERLLKAFEAA
jgi:hypothetical protein